MSSKKVLLLVGSPKKDGGVSQTIVDHLAHLIKGLGGETDAVNVLGLMDETSGMDRLVAKWSSSDVIVLSFPLYVDSPPSGVVRMFELLAARKEELGGQRSLLLIGNCGNPDPGKLGISMDICGHFAHYMGMHMMGDLRLPMGPVLEGRPMADTGRIGRHARTALELTSAAIMKGGDLPEAASKEMSKRPMPEFLYIMAANRSMKKRAKASGARYQMMDKPYGR